MSETQSATNKRHIELRRRLRDDFPYYAPHCLKIRPKEIGHGLVPLRLNTAQMFLHLKAEEQRARIGRVRLLILKGRQEGCCLSPKTRVMTADYRWVTLDEISVGERVLAVDENSAGLGRGNARKFRTAIVEAKVALRKQTLEVCFDNGVRLEITPEHRLLFKRRCGPETTWEEMRWARIGDLVRIAVDPPRNGERSFEDGWMGGILDGEGSFGASPQVRISITQVAGPVLCRARQYLASNGVKFYEAVDTREPGETSKLGSKPVHRLRIDAMRDVIAILERTQPARFVQRELFVGKKLPKEANGRSSWARITSIRPLGVQRVIDLQTSEKTFIAEGLVSHNSTFIGARFYHKLSHLRGAKAFILTHKDDATENLFDMIERFHKNVPSELRPITGKDNKQELTFLALESGFKVGTAGSKGVGRSETLQFFHWCVAEGTSVLSPDGSLVAIERLRPGDFVRTHTNEIAPISFVSETAKECWRILLKGLRGFPLIVSGEHRLWTRTGWAKAQHLDVGDVVGFPVRTVTNQIKRVAFRHRNARIDAIGPNSVALDYAFGRIVGLYLAEGHAGKTRVSFVVHENEVDRTIAWLSEVRNLFSSVSIRRRDSKAVAVEVNGTALSRFLGDFVGRTDGKRLPHGWWMMGDEFARGMLHGYLSGDGHFSGSDRIIAATSVRPAITTGMRDILASLGYGWAGIQFKPSGVRHGRNERAAYVLRLCGSGVERLSQECGKPFLPRKRRDRGNYGTVEVSDGYAWAPIVEKIAAGVRRVFDLEVAHSDHSYCTLQAAVHNSEVAFCPNADDHLAGILQAVPDAAGTEIWLESTSDGMGNLFHRECIKALKGQSNFEFVFVPWFWMEEYRKAFEGEFIADKDERDLAEQFGLDDEQLNWRRSKISELNGVDRFNKEYPNTPEEAFEVAGVNVLIGSRLVRAAVEREVRQVEVDIVWGVDCARFGDDDNTLAKRRGNRLLEPVRVILPGMANTDTMAVARAILREFRQTPPSKRPKTICVDTIGIGAGVADRCREDGLPVLDVNVSEKPSSSAKFKKLRDELWWDMREWYEDMRSSMPDDEALIHEISAITYDEDSAGRIKVEGKKEMKKRLGFSPDRAEAFLLTFAASDLASSSRGYEPADIEFEVG